MKKKILLLIMLLTGVIAYGQSDRVFYYYGGKKQFFNTDSTSAVVVMKTDVGTEKLKQRAFDVQSERQAGNRKAYKIQTKFALDRKALKKELGAEKVYPVLVERGKEIATLTELIVCLKEQTTQDSFDKLLNKTGTFIDHKYSYGKNAYIVGTRDTTQATTLDLANEFYETGLFNYSEPNFQLLNVINYTVTDPYYNSYQWSLRLPSQNGIDMMNAWNLDNNDSLSAGNNIRVAIIDTGVDNVHEEFSVAGKCDNNYEVISKNFNKPRNSHGTSCAGIIGATKNYVGITGISYKCHIIPIVAVDAILGCNFEDIATAINYAWDNASADVINCSFGFYSFSTLVDNAIDNAVNYGRNSLGCVIIASTGNDTLSHISYPACNSKVIAVGSTGNSSTRSTFSNYGTGLDIVAPGESIFTTDIRSTWGSNNFSGNNNYCYFSGTSAAAPHVSGVVASLLSTDPTLRYIDVRRAIESNTDKVGSYSYVTTSGKPNGTWNNEVGYGRLNAYKALKSIKNKPTTVTLSLSTSNPIAYSSTLTFSVTATNLPTGATCEWSVNPKTLTKLSTTSTSISLKFGSSGNASLTDTVWCKMNYNGVNYTYYKSFSITPYEITNFNVTSNQVWGGYRIICDTLDLKLISIAPGKKLTINGVIVSQNYTGFEVKVGAELILNPTAKIVCPANKYGEEYSWGGITVDINNNLSFPNNVGLIQRWPGSEIPKYTAVFYVFSGAPNSVYYSDLEPIESRQVFWNYRIEDTVVWNKNKIIPASGISIAPFGSLTMKDSTFYMGSNANIDIEGYPYFGTINPDLIGYPYGGSLKLQNCSIKAINPTWKWGGITMHGEDANLVKSLRMESLPNKPQNYISDASNAVKIIGADSLCRWDVVRIEDTRFENCTKVLDISRFYTFASLQDSLFRMHNCDILSKFNCINLDHVFNFNFTNNRIERLQESYSQIMIKANHCTDLLFYGNSFNPNNSNMSATGINLINSTGSISGNTFKNLQIGVALADTVSTDKNILVEYNDFINNYYSLQASYIRGVSVKDNAFYCNVQNSIGAMISNCSKFDISGNWFTERSLDPVATANIKGLYITSTSTSYFPRLVRNNSFEDLFIGAECNGYNRAINGTKFRCNDFAYNTTALKVTYQGSSSSGQGLFDQDTITHPAGNTFLNNTTNIYNYATLFYYYYRNLANENPSVSSTNVNFSLITGNTRCEESYASSDSSVSSSILSSESLQNASVSDLQNTDYLLSAAEQLVDERDYNDACSFIAQSESLSTNEESAERNGRWREMLDLKMSLARSNVKELAPEQTAILESLAKENRFDRAGSWASNLLTISKDTVELIPVYPFDPNQLEQSAGIKADTINRWLKISPNPGFATISIFIAKDVYKIEGKKILTISDLSGNVLWSSILKEDDTFVLPDKTFEPGSYTCTLSGSKGVISSTIAIVK